MRYLFKRSAVVAAVGSAALFAACKDSTSVPDLNNVSSATIAGGLNAATAQLLLSGLLNNNRTNNGFRYLVFAETMARDVYNLDPAESRFITELLGVPIDPSAFTGGGSWLGYFQSIRTGKALLEGIGSAQGLSAQEQAGVRGITHTIMALELLRAWEMRGNNGIPVTVPNTINDPVSPILCTPNALAAISAILDSGATDLAAAGSSFGQIQLPAGFSTNGSFDNPAGFLKFNRAIKGQVEVYRGLAGNAASFTAAVTALNASFLDTTATTLTGGVYYTYSTAPGETQRPIAASTIYLNPSVGDSIQAGDLRAAKIKTIARVTRNNVQTTYTTTLSDPANLTGPIPIIRNAELILLRAQAEIGLGQLDAATRDLNVVRRKEGGLPNYATFTSATAAINALLYEKRYSLLLEGGAHRLVDLRFYNRFNATNLRKEQSADAFNSVLPIPKTEIDLRGGNVTCQ
ncbi:RagB/SusD domain-containing protein [Gemmatirosa kalamazoonensis]|uniref:RagB/SusD domain-containing protein n=1 Tax=Gemmatirosa kalamazoonensis TaxID=861299 RepID=W0RHG6_9BACT|nr:RagB/SusD family nutrient uptake outer membrane protein [Gemmatirosa kalamazoonensis]AHG90201.1 RagB/SusD domain-containing protein [Gemmatirosa kalamazoonensis]